jgi:uncharacterized membrane protein
MAPFLVLVAVVIGLRLLGLFRARLSTSWQQSTRLGLVVMFLFTGATHFTAMKYDYAAMIPPPFTGDVWIITVTGALEIAGAAGLVIPATRRAAAICLAVLLVAMFPANVHAAVAAVPFRGESPTELWLRAPIQLLFVIALWWSSIRRVTRDDQIGMAPVQRRTDPETGM